MTIPRSPQVKHNNGHGRSDTQPAPPPISQTAPEGRVRYAVVGLGNISQIAILPGFLTAKANSEVVALVSDDDKKLESLAKSYHVKDCYHYDQYGDCLASGKIDAVYIALPNHLHREFAVKAAHAGVHVLCEKPLAKNERECFDIIRACDDCDVKLMAAYRLHFERANLEAIKILQAGTIGEPRFFNSIFSQQVKEGYRTKREAGGGTLYDIGIYCINAARYLFRADPQTVSAFATKDHDQRFAEVDEMTSALLRFPGKRFATFTCSFGAADTAEYIVVGTKGTLRLKSGYEFSQPMRMEITVGGKVTRRSFGRRDQFGPELAYFSECILKDRQPEPGGLEGLTDVHVIRSLYESARSGHAVAVKQFPPHRRPDIRHEDTRRWRDPLSTVHNESTHE